MKNKDLIMLGAAGIAAYYLLFNKKAATPTETLVGAVGGAVGGVTGQLAENFKANADLTTSILGAFAQSAQQAARAAADAVNSVVGGAAAATQQAAPQASNYAGNAGVSGALAYATSALAKSTTLVSDKYQVIKPNVATVGTLNIPVITSTQTYGNYAGQSKVLIAGVTSGAQYYAARDALRSSGIINSIGYLIK